MSHLLLREREKKNASYIVGLSSDNSCTSPHLSFWNHISTPTCTVPPCMTLQSFREYALACLATYTVPPDMLILLMW